MKYGFKLKSGDTWPEEWARDDLTRPGYQEITHDGLVMHCFSGREDFIGDFITGYESPHVPPESILPVQLVYRHAEFEDGQIVRDSGYEWVEIPHETLVAWMADYAYGIRSIRAVVEGSEYAEAVRNRRSGTTTNQTQTEAKPESLSNQPPVSSGRVTVDLTREEAQGLADFLAHGAMDASMPVENRIRDEVAARLRAALAAARSVGEGAADE